MRRASLLGARRQASGQNKCVPRQGDGGGPTRGVYPEFSKGSHTVRLLITTSARVADLKVARGRDRVIVQYARVRLGTDPSPLAQDDNFSQEEINDLLNISGMTDGGDSINFLVSQ